MKTIVVFYSLNGNTAFAADRIATTLKADLLALETVKPYPKKGFAKFFHGGKAAVFGDEPELQPFNADLSGYDLILLGTPVWAGTFSPPLRSFCHLAKSCLGDKIIAAFASSSGGSAEKAFKKLENEVGYQFSATLHLVDPLTHPNEGNEKRISDFCRALSNGKNE
ncbi:MAG: NAD(P)H-dependent oxidoreductase [Clostridia bacterium]|nr:NAD(P)H-dependent oxidoreductase [Clostridia bacterium]